MLIPTNTITQAEIQSAIIRNVLVVDPAITVMDAITQMSGVRILCSVGEVAATQFDDVHIEDRSSCVLIVEDNKLIGIFTERDVVRLSSQQRSLYDLQIREVMTHPVVTLKESAFEDIFLAINLLKQYQIRHLPIVDDSDRLVGLLTYESLRQTLRPVDWLRLRLVMEVMSSNVICATTKTSMLVVANLMAENYVGYVVIIEQNKKPVGIITEHDIVQFQALGLDLERCQVEAVMSTPIFTVTSDSSLWEAQQMMEQRHIRQIAVTNFQNELLGIVTQSSLLQLLNPVEMYKFAEVLENKISRLEAEKLEIMQNRTVELEQQIQERTITLTIKTERERLIAQIANRIRNSLNVEEILTACVAEVRAFLACDRVLVYQFQADYNGIVVCESVGDGWISSLNHHIQDTCFQEHAVKLYEYGRTTAIDNIYTVGYANCHIELLEKYQVKSNLIVPIIVSGKLWGLLIGHQCQDFRSWHMDDITLLDEMGVQLAIAIQQATAYQQAQTELEERRKTEARLRESEQRYASLASAAPVGIFRTDAQGYNIYINQRGLEIIGISEVAAKGNGWQQALHPDDREEVIRESAQSRHENRPFQLEYRFLNPEGRVTWVHGQAIPEFNYDGELIGYIGTITDITARRQAELLLKMQNNLLERIVKGEALGNILDALIYSIEEQLPGALCSILLCNFQGQLVPLPVCPIPTINKLMG
jgi:PAS domain S-box-containing protein